MAWTAESYIHAIMQLCSSTSVTTPTMGLEPHDHKVKSLALYRLS